MRVIHFSFSDLHPGAAMCSYRIHRGLLQCGVDSRMLVSNRLSQDPTVSGPTTSLDRLWAPRATTFEFHVKGLLQKAPDRWIRPLGPESSLGLLGSGLLRHIDTLEPDVVMLHWIAAGLIRPAGLSRIARYPLIWTLFDMWPFVGVDHYTEETERYVSGYTAQNHPSHAGFDIDRWAWKRKYRAIRRLPNLTLACPSRWLAREAERSATFEGRRVEVIPTSVDRQAFAPVDRDEARRELGIPTDARVVAFGAVFGAQEPRKGAAELVSALNLLHETASGLNILLITFGAPDESTNKLLALPTKQLGMLKPGLLPSVYSSADVFVAPSLQENLANTVLESLACGTPVVAFNIGGMPEAIDHLRTGYLAQPRDIADLARGIKAMLSLSTAEREAMSQRARHVILSRHSGEKEAAAYMKLCADVIAGGS